MNTTIENFKDLCAQIKLREQKTYGYNEIEDLLEKALNFIKTHKENRQQFVDFFSSKILADGDQGLVYGNEHSLVQTIQFCMRELQWPEIEEASIKNKSSSSDWRVKGTMDNILEVYEEEWPDDELYTYYMGKKK